MSSDWAQIWAGATTLLTFGLLVATAIYAWLTWRLVSSSERQSWELTRPRVMVSLQTTQGGVYMVLQIENVGMLPAVDLTLSLDRPVFSETGTKREIGTIPLFADGLPSLPPRTRIRIGLGTSFSYLRPEVDRELHPLSFVVNAQNTGAKRAIEESYPIDVERQLISTAVDKDYAAEFGRTFPDKFDSRMHEVTRAIESLGRDVAKEDVG